MVGGLFNPLNIFIIGLGGGFLIPLAYRAGKTWPGIVFFAALTGITIISGVAFWSVLAGGPPIEIFTAGGTAPYVISLRLGVWEGFFAFALNVVGWLGAWHLWPRLRDHYAAMLLYLILVMGIDGMVMTRDLFNLFVFLEIVSIGTYGLFALERRPAAIAASFKYIMATVLASTFFLFGTGLTYFATGTLDIDAIIAMRQDIGGPIGMAGLLLLLGGLLVKLKPFPANGWGLDVYETAPSGVAAQISVGVSAGAFFALVKLLPLFEAQLTLIAVSGGATFLASNLIGLRQDKVKRLLGYSSIGQMGLMMLALALLQRQGAAGAMPLVIGGLFVNHLIAKAGLFWLAGIVGAERVDSWPSLIRRPALLVVFAIFTLAICGLPPFPAFWAKWQLVQQLAGANEPVWIGVILLGSLLEIGYFFRWFETSLRRSDGVASETVPLALQGPVLIAALLLIVTGVVAADAAGAASPWLFLPLVAGAALGLADRLPGPVKCVLMLGLVLAGGFWLIRDTTGIGALFAFLLIAGSVVIAAAGLYRSDRRPGYHALMAVMLLSLGALFRASTGLEFFFSWEMITVSSYFLIAQGRGAAPHTLRFLLFSMGSAFFLLAAFAFAQAATGSPALAALASGAMVPPVVYALFCVGFLIKAGAFGVHVWLPGAYAEADDDLTAMLSAVISKAAMFGLLVGSYLAIRSPADLGLAHLLAWIGLLTTVAGALMALRQDDFKRMLAYSSMSQIGYIITAIALMSHIGWVTALYLVANHLMVKGILFLAIAGVILRTGTRRFDDVGGLARQMPATFAAVVVALVAMSGLPPLMGFGGKWLLLAALNDKDWFWLVVATLLATFLGFLYMAKLAYAVFLRPSSTPAGVKVREAPLALLVPQWILVAGILALSFYPGLVMEPIAAAIDPYFAATLVWQGLPLEAIYTLWNPLPAMGLAVAAAICLGVLVWLAARWRGAAGFQVVLQLVVRWLSPPLATEAWNRVALGAGALAGGARRIYTGNGQTYMLYVLLYIAAIYLLGGGKAGP